MVTGMNSGLPTDWWYCPVAPSLDFGQREQRIGKVETDRGSLKFFGLNWFKLV
jgi:hypothetical protein